MDNEEFNSEQQDEEKQGREIFESLVRFALTGEHNKFEFIRSLGELRLVLSYKKRMKATVRMFKGIKKDINRRYVHTLSSGGNIDLLFMLGQYDKIIRFYKAEVAVLKSMIDEYSKYVRSGHIIDSLLGIYRPETDLVDFRILPITWF